MSSVISQEQAQKEVDSWLDFKKVSEKKRLSCKGNIDRLVDALCEGHLILDPATKVFTQKLKFPFGKEVEVSELKFKPRITVSDAQSRTLNVVQGDGYGNAFAYIAAATGEDMNVISKMDPEDYYLSGDLVVFFMFA
jgi:hypothetical protein